MAFTFASTMDEVFHLALLPLPHAQHADSAPVSHDPADVWPGRRNVSRDRMLAKGDS